MEIAIKGNFLSEKLETKPPHCVGIVLLSYCQNSLDAKSSEAAGY